MVCQALLGNGCDATIRAVAVVTVFRRAVPHPVLDHGRHSHAVDTGSAVLKPLDVRAHERSGHVRVLTEGAVDSAPTWLRGEVRLRRERHVNAHCPVLLPRDIAEAAHECRISYRRKAERLWPLGELPSAHTCAEHVLEVVARVRADRERDAESRAFGDLLKCIVRGCEFACVAGKPRNHARDLRSIDQDAARGGVVHRSKARAATAARTARSAVHHRAGLLLERHARHEIAGARVGREAPVLVRVDAAIPVQIAEAQSSLFEDGRVTRSESRLCRRSRRLRSLGDCKKR